MELECIETDYPSIKALRKVADEFEVYIRNNAWMIPNYAERRRYGERVSTGFVESAVNTVVGKRFGKRQQMQWSKPGAHLMLQTRARALDGTLRGKFEQWYPGLKNDDTTGKAEQLVKGRMPDCRRVRRWHHCHLLPKNRTGRLLFIRLKQTCHRMVASDDAPA